MIFLAQGLLLILPVEQKCMNWLDQQITNHGHLYVFNNCVIGMVKNQ